MSGFDMRSTGPPRSSVKLLWLFERYRIAMTTWTVAFSKFDFLLFSFLNYWTCFKKICLYFAVYQSTFPIIMPFISPLVLFLCCLSVHLSYYYAVYQSTCPIIMPFISPLVLLLSRLSVNLSYYYAVYQSTCPTIKPFISQLVLLLCRLSVHFSYYFSRNNLWY
jgi:hypothetical protein